MIACMKSKSQTPPSDPSQAMLEYEEVPEETKRLLELKQASEKATGKTAEDIQKKLQQIARDPKAAKRD